MQKKQLERIVTDDCWQGFVRNAVLLLLAFRDVIVTAQAFTSITGLVFFLVRTK